MNLASVVQAFATLLWMATVGIVVLAVIRASRGRPMKGATSLVIGAVVFAVVITLVGAGMVFIEPTERGVVTSPYSFRAPKGYLENALMPGLHWVVPGERVIPYSISRLTYTMAAASNEGQVSGDDSIRARTKDGQEVFIDASVIYSVNPEEVIKLHIQWQTRYQDEVVRPLVRGIIRDTASQYGVEEIVSSKRAEMEEYVTAELLNKLEENGLMLVDFILRDIHFSDEYAAAVEQKQIAEQQALQAHFVVEQKKQEAEQARQVAEGQADAAVIAAKGAAESRTIQAEAEAKALQMINAVLTGNPDLLTYQYITKLSPEVKVIILPNGSQFILPPELIAP